MNNEVLHYATPLMRTLNLIHQQYILDHPPLYPWDSNVTMDFGSEAWAWASLLSMDDALKGRTERDSMMKMTLKELFMLQDEANCRRYSNSLKGFDNYENKTKKLS